ncbi:type II secretion system protein [bacterium]|nr:type II secretion system protein [bacterium]
MKKGFTLAEVLITLAIIGVVAAMTIPTLIANYQKKTYVTQLQKTYSMIANAAKMLMADEMVENLNHTYLFVDEDAVDSGDEEAYKNSVGVFLNKYFRVTKDCGYGSAKNDLGCLAKEYTVESNGSFGDIQSFGGHYCVNINNGSTICMTPFTKGYPAGISIDVNGLTGPNVMGRDAFILSMNYRGEIAESFSDPSGMHLSELCGDSSSSGYMYGLGCFTKIVEDGWKMDY